YGKMEDGTLFLAMEYLDGKDLQQTITRDGALGVERSLHILRQIADALGGAHQLGVVHRDIKPSNVMLIARGHTADVVKVLDFGIAKLESAGATGTGAIYGTPQYMSPEQF